MISASIEIELLGDRPVGLLDQRQAVLDRREDAAIARIGPIVDRTAGGRRASRDDPCRAESRDRDDRPAASADRAPQARSAARCCSIVAAIAPASAPAMTNQRLSACVALVIVGDQRLAADDRRHLLQPFGRNLQRRQRAGADGIRPDHRADARDDADLAQAAKDAMVSRLVERGGAADDLERACRPAGNCAASGRSVSVRSGSGLIVRSSSPAR